MILITEAQSSAIVTPELAFGAVREAFIDAVAPGAASFPVVFAHGSDPQNLAPLVPLRHVPDHFPLPIQPFR